MIPAEIEAMSMPELLALEAMLRDRADQWSLTKWFPDEGPLRRELYPKHMAFFAAGAKYHERLFMAANRVGKTVTGAYETALHLTGLYPDWWEGKRFANSTNGWAVGKTSETTRDIVQLALCGPTDRMGTGMIPADLITSYRFKQNTNQSLDWISVKNVSGKNSWLGIKSYDQGRKAFEGTAKDFVWLDEEPPLNIYTECLTRTATLDGVIYDTFTPLEGATAMVLSFMEPGIDRI